MTTRDELREKVAAGLRTRLAVNVLRHAPQVGHGWINELSVALATDVLAVVRAELAEPSEAMTDAAWGASLGPMIGERQMPPGFPGINTAIYQAMLSASPLAEPGA